MPEKSSQWLPLIISLIAGFFALKQIRINNITNARLKWLDGLKILVSDFFSEYFIFILRQEVEKGIDHIQSLGKTNQKADFFLEKIPENTLGHLKIISAKHE